LAKLRNLAKERTRRNFGPR